MTMDDLAGTLPQPERRLIGTRGEYLAAVDELAVRVRRELRIFDPDCVQLELTAPARAQALRQFLLASRDNRLLIAVHDPEHLRRHAPRMLTLIAEFRASIAVHQTEGEALRAQDCFLLADVEHFVRRPVATAARGVYVINEPSEARLMRERFDEIWQYSFPAISATTLGL
jgi:hypothetical protein